MAQTVRTSNAEAHADMYMRTLIGEPIHIQWASTAALSLTVLGSCQIPIRQNKASSNAVKKCLLHASITTKDDSHKNRAKIMLFLDLPAKKRRKSTQRHFYPRFKSFLIRIYYFR